MGDENIEIMQYVAWLLFFIVVVEKGWKINKQ
jgi:hypothetical protein